MRSAFSSALPAMRKIQLRSSLHCLGIVHWQSACVKSGSARSTAVRDVVHGTSSCPEVGTTCWTASVDDHPMCEGHLAMAPASVQLQRATAPTGLSAVVADPRDVIGSRHHRWGMWGLHLVHHEARDGTIFQSALSEELQERGPRSRVGSSQSTPSAQVSRGRHGGIELVLQKRSAAARGRSATCLSSSVPHSWRAKP